MSAIRRFGFLILINFMIMITIGFVVRLLGLDYYINSSGSNLPQVLIFCMLWGFGGAFISLFMSKSMAKMAMGVEIIDPKTSNPSERALVDLVHRLAKQAQLPEMPEVGIYQSPEVNAFATGPSRSNSLVAVSTGLLNSMDRGAVEGVLGHEVAHIANGDMVTMTLLQGVINSFVLFLARIIGSIVDSAMRGDREDRGPGFGYMITVMVAEMFLGILGSIVLMYYSRQREFRADAGGAQVAGRQNMISALQALQRLQERNFAPEVQPTPAFANLKISAGRGNFLAALISTHPSLEERIARLQQVQSSSVIR